MDMAYRGAYGSSSRRHCCEVWTSSWSGLSMVCLRMGRSCRWRSLCSWSAVSSSTPSESRWWDLRHSWGPWPPRPPSLPSVSRCLPVPHLSWCLLSHPSSCPSCLLLCFARNPRQPHPFHPDSQLLFPPAWIACMPCTFCPWIFLPWGGRRDPNRQWTFLTACFLLLFHSWFSLQ